MGASGVVEGPAKGLRERVGPLLLGFDCLEDDGALSDVFANEVALYVGVFVEGKRRGTGSKLDSGFVVDKERRRTPLRVPEVPEVRLRRRRIEREGATELSELHVILVDGPPVGPELAFREEVSVRVRREEDLLEEDFPDEWST